jgi:PucR C-terminal helix-turn-helix domain/GGDEF-like domain
VGRDDHAAKLRWSRRAAYGIDSQEIGPVGCGRVTIEGEEEVLVVSTREKSLEATLEPAAARLVDALEAAIPEIAAGGAQTIRDEIEAYRERASPALLDDIDATMRANLAMIVQVMRTGRQVTTPDLSFLRGSATRRARTGIPLADFVHAYRIGLRVAWEALLERAENEASRLATLSLFGHFIEYINVTSTYVAEVYAEVEQLLRDEGEHVRQELLGDLLCGRRPPPGPRDEALRLAGLTADGEYVVISARPVAAADAYALRAAASALGRTGARTSAPLAVVRGQEIVAAVPIEPQGAAALVRAVRDAGARLAGDGIELTVGASTVVSGLDLVAAAYREASDAHAISDAGGVLCLCELKAFDHLMLVGHETTARLISPDIARFVADDLAEGGVLTATFLEYAATDLNAKAASERLFIHVNTAHNRLAKIAESTGRDLRSLNDVIEILIAISLARGRSGPA